MTLVSSKSPGDLPPRFVVTTCMGASSASPVSSPGPAHPGDLTPGKGNVRIQVCMEQFTGQHPAIKDAFPGKPIDTLVAQGRYNLAGKFSQPMPQGVQFVYADNPYGVGTIPSASATVTPLSLAKGGGYGLGESGQFLIACDGFVAEKITGSCPISPDYGVAYITAYEYFTAPAPPFSPQCVPWTALFTVRVWHDMTAKLAPLSGDKQSTIPNKNFPATLSVTTTDSVGSEQAVDGLQVIFSITSGNAAFDPSGVTTRYCEIQDGFRALVLSQQGIAISPPIKAGPGVGTVIVLAQSNFSRDIVQYTLNIN